MIRPTQQSLQPADASVFVTARGVPSWGAILIALVFGVGGIVVNRLLQSTPTGWAFSVVFTVGIAIAVLAVRRGSIFTGMVQAPIVFAIVVFVAYRTITSEGTIFSASKIVTEFPTMAIATGVGLLLGLIRIIAQPTREARGAAPGGGRAAARA